MITNNNNIKNNNNKKNRNPRGNIENPQERGKDKVQMILDWIGRFHFSTNSIITKLLKVDKTNANRVIKKLKGNQIIHAVEVSVVREEILMLTKTGLSLCRELSDKIFSYHTEPCKLNIGKIRHDLNVQVAVLEKINENKENKKVREKEKNCKDIKNIYFQSERELDLANQQEDQTNRKQKNQREQKIPDAIIIYEYCDNYNFKTALEVELNPKTDRRIYIGFMQHIKAIQDERLYDHVTYIFKTKTLKEYYAKRFMKSHWTQYRLDKKRKRFVKSEKPFIAEQETIKELFSFVVEPLYRG